MFRVSSFSIRATLAQAKSTEPTEKHRLKNDSFTNSIHTIGTEPLHAFLGSRKRVKASFGRFPGFRIVLPATLPECESSFALSGYVADCPRLQWRPPRRICTAFPFHAHVPPGTVHTERDLHNYLIAGLIPAVFEMARKMFFGADTFSPAQRAARASKRPSSLIPAGLCRLLARAVPGTAPQFRNSIH